MTKSLTEQWREGTLENGFYYVMSGWSTSIEIRYLGNGFFEGNIKVLEPVPSYDEWKQAKENLEKNGTWYTERSYKRLEKQLKIATKALEEIRKRIEDFNDDPMNKIGFMAYGTLHECLKKSKQSLKGMEGVK